MKNMAATVMTTRSMVTSTMMVASTVKGMAMMNLPATEFPG